MKTDQELQQLMRATFAGRAESVTRSPIWTVPPSDTDGRFGDERPGRPGPRGRWIAAVAAAAAVVAVVASVSVVRDHSDGPATSTTPTPTPLPTTSSPSPTNSTTVIKQPTIPLACTVPLPTAWNTALANSVLPSGSATPSTTTMSPLATTDDGGIIASRDDGPTPGSGREVILLKRGHSPTILYSLPQPDRYGIASADVSGNWLVVGVQNQGRPGKGTIGGNTPDVIDAIVVVDLTDGHSQVIVSSPDYLKPNAQLDTGIAIVNAAVFDGKVYWAQRPSYAATTGAVKSYDLASGKRTTVAPKTTGYLVAETQGLVVDPQLGGRKALLAATLPHAVSSVMTDFGLQHLGTDGTAYAWAVDQTTVGWWRPGQRAPIYLRIPGGFDIDDSGGTPVVAGEFVVTQQSGGAEFATDMLTKASTPLNPPDTRTGFEFGRGTYLTGYTLSAIKAHFVNGYWLDTPFVVRQLNTVSLPKLSC